MSSLYSNASSTRQQILVPRQNGADVQNRLSKDRSITESRRQDLSIDLHENLSRCGLLQYLEVLAENGFDTWDTVLDIQEGDLEAMEFKLGHRRKLQRQIMNYRSCTALENPSLALDTEPASHKPRPKRIDKAGACTKTSKRRYTRRPKPDTNAPKKPRTGYVLFSNHIRSQSETAVMPFAALAKHVGHKWQLLGTQGRKKWEERAAKEMSVYLDCLDTYKQSDKYREYQSYMAKFRGMGNDHGIIDKSTIDTQNREHGETQDGDSRLKEVRHSY
jgi:hypothetical protein